MTRHRESGGGEAASHPVLEELTRLEAWATHYLYLVHGRVARAGPLPSEPELLTLRQSGAVSPLARLVERWMRAEPARSGI